MTTPAGAGTVSVTVTNPDGQSGSLTAAFTYLAPPALVGVTPVTGPSAGGSTVTFSGSGFQNGMAAKFGASLASSVQVQSETTAVVKTPAGNVGSVAVTVTNPDGQSASLASAFTYLGPPPSLASLNPISGPSAGGMVVTLEGSGFQNGMVVKFGTSQATSVQVSSGTSGLATTPPGSGSVNVTVINPDGQSSTLASAFTYQASPMISGASPNPVNYAGGTVVNIVGSGFVNGLTVMFGTITAPPASVQVLSSNSIFVTTPPAPVGTIAITITNPDGSSATFNGFSFVRPDVSNAIVSASIQACSVKGSVSQAVLPDLFKIVIYASTNEYYVQSCATQPVNSISPNGSWGPVPSHSGYAIYVLLVSATYNPPATTYSLPPVDGVNVFSVSKKSQLGRLVGCDVSSCPARVMPSELRTQLGAQLTSLAIFGVRVIPYLTVL